MYAEKRDELLPGEKEKQEILVLRDGFTGFQQLYRVSRVSQAPSWRRSAHIPVQDDPALVEKFNKLYHD